MDSGASRLVLAAAMLAGLWIVVYWITPAPMGDEQPPPITFEASPHDDPEGGPADGAVRDGGPLATIDPLAGRVPVNPENPENPEIMAPEQMPVVIAPTFTSYTWQRGDDLAALAERFYGDSDLAMVISKANPTRDMRRIKPGTVLRIPDDPHNIQGLDVDPVTGEVIAQKPDSIDKGLVTEYVVERSDTLTGIAYALYGKASLWTVIRDANLHQLKRQDGSDIRPGMRLVIPPPPDLSTAGSRSTN
jgi:nucleoid-associated protein YgaU